MNKEEVLKKFGLTEKETKVYLANLELGQTTANQIARKSNIFRTYCYDIIKSLIEKGLIAYVIKSGTKYFEAIDPEKLIEILHEKEDQIKLILPELKEIQSRVEEKPKIEVYEGREGIKTIHENILRTKPNEVLVYGNTTKHEEVMQWYFPRYIKERVKNKIKTRVLTEESQTTRKNRAQDKKELRQTKFFQNPTFFPVLKYIYQNKVATISLGHNIIGVIIENQDIADGEKAAFEILWKSAKQ